MQTFSSGSSTGRLRSLFKWVLLTLLAAPVALLALLAMLQTELDLSASKDRVADLAGWMLGQDVRIAGDVHLGLGGNPSLAISGLSVSDPAGVDAGGLGADRLFVRVNLGALLGGRLKATEVLIEGGQATLHRGGEYDAPSSDGWLRFADVLENQQLIPDRLKLEIKDARIDFAGDRNGAKSDLQLVSGKANRVSRESPFELEVTGSWDGTPLSAKGSLQASAEAGEQARYVAKFVMQLLGIDAGLEGTVTRTRAGELQADLKLDAHSKDLSPWHKVLGIGSLPVKKARVKARFKSESGTMSLEVIKANLDQGGIVGNLSLRQDGERPAVRGKLQVSDLDLGRWRRWFMAHDSGEEEAGDLFDWLAGIPVPGPVDAEISLDGDKILQPTGRTRNLGFDLALDQRTMKVTLVERQAPKAGFEASLEKSAGAGGFEYRFVLRDPKIDLASLVAGSKIEGMIEGEMATSVELRSSGSTAGEIRSALNGKIDLLMGAGKANVAALDRLVGGLTQAVGEVFTEKTKLAVVNCSAFDATLKGGVATIKLGLVDTSYSTVLISGAVDLAKGRLDLDVKPFKKALSLSVAPEVIITDSLHEPSYEIKKGSLLLSLTELITNVAYPPSLLVGVFAEAAGHNPCVKMLKGGKTAKAKQEEEPPSVDQP